MNTLLHILLIGSAGAAGALVRYGVSVGAPKWFGEAFPWGTLIVNVAGCFLLGFLTGLTTGISHPSWRAAAHTGFLGALTTFSTFGVETFTHYEKGEYGVAGMNVAANLTAGFAAVWLGMTLARYWSQNGMSSS